jgi:K+-transporting ATPase ATPase C chain
MTIIRQAFVLFLVLAMLTGVVYPFVMTGVAQVVFPRQANGSLIVRDGKLIGSALVGQQFDNPRYFWGRPSAGGYNGGASTGSNYGPTNPTQLDAVRNRAAKLRDAHPDQSGLVPVELVTASGSGLDPHIGPAAAEYQVGRIAKVRSMAPAKVRELVARQTEGRTLGVLGEPRVNVLKLNLALDGLN